MNYRLRVNIGQGVRRGGDIMPEVSWTSDTCVGVVSGLVDLFRTTFVFEINSSGYSNSTGQFNGYRAIYRTVPPEGGDSSMNGMLEGCGEDIGIVSVFSDPFCATFVYESFTSGQRISVPGIIDRRPEG